jgi:phosphoribosylformylglycinamidine cyclo-ligase
MNNNRYMMRGVSAAKEDVHNAIKNIDKGIFPQAFCKIIPDILGGDPEYCNIMHADGAGTKSSLAYMYWKETGDLSVWKGIAQDAIVMNTDDLLCVGAVDNILVSSTIGRNKMLIPGEVISAISTELTNCFRNYAKWASAYILQVGRPQTWATLFAPSLLTQP